MNRLAVLLICLLAATSGAAIAQIPPPATPIPDPRSYKDPGMTFMAPPNAYLMARRYLSLGDLSEDLQPVAAWVVDPGKENARTIQIAMEAYNGPPGQWEGVFESQTHSSQDGTLIRDKTPMTLLNGMPAYFVEVTTGSGFDSRKTFAVVWADGQRGIVLSENTRLGDASADEAKEFLKQVTAVQYPLDQP